MIFLSSLFITLYSFALYPSYNVYLTQGETYSLPLNELFKEIRLNFTILDCPSNVQLFKTLNLLSEQNNNQKFTSISSSSQYYLLTTQVNVLNLYFWNSGYLNLINKIKLPQQTCLNALLTKEDSIIVDCYNLNNLSIYLYQKNSWTIAYSELTQQIPKKTDLKQFISNSINFILYAQYYEDNQILTQFYFSQDQLYNFSIWTQPFINFIVTNKLQSQNTIYLWNNQFLYILNVTEYELQSTNIVYFSQIIDVLLFNPQNMFYQCDKLLIIAHDQSLQFQVCNQNTMIQEYQNQINLNNVNYISQAFLSNQFLILQLFDLIEIYEIIDFYFNLIGGLQLNSSFSQVSFDYNSNQLFIFSDTEITTYQVAYPKIKFESDQNLSNYQLFIQGSPYQINQTDAYKCQNCMVQVNVSVLSINDNNTYLTHEISHQIVINFLSQHYHKFISQYSGSLLVANFSVDESSLGNFTDTTFRNIGSINQKFENLQFLSGGYAVGITNQTIVLISLQMQHNHFNQQIMNFIECNWEIQPQQQFILTFLEPFQQFYLLFQQIVLLLESNIIQICNFFEDCTDLQIKNDIKPVGIALNQQLCSSTLYINNNHKSIIVGQITSSNTYIIFSQIDVKIQVQDMKIVNNRLILNYYCQQNQFICFQVWNVANLNSPYFEKNLRSILNSNNIQLFADNLFYYVQTNNQIYVYNPVVLEHSSLFYTFNYNGSYFTTTSIQSKAFISFNSQFYQLFPILVYSYQTTINMFQNDITLLLNTFNASISSQIGTQTFIDYISNQDIIILNNFLQIQPKNQTYNVSQSHVTLTSDNITFSGQVGWFSISCDGKSNSQVINILNFTSMRKNVIAAFNKQILVLDYYQQNYLICYLQVYNITSKGTIKRVSLQQKYPKYCLNRFAQMNAQYIFLVCAQTYQQSYLGYDLVMINITNASLGQMTTLSNFTIIELSPILQDDTLYICNRYQISIYYINQNIFQRIQTQCNLISFQLFVYQNSNYSFYANIYLCKDDQKLYYQLGKRYLQEQIQFISVKFISIENFFYLDSYIVGILIVSEQKTQLAMMCFTNQISFIIRLNYTINESDFQQSTLAFKNLLFYSPPQRTNYLYQFKQAMISSGLVVVYYQSYYPQYLDYYVLYNTSYLNFTLGNQENTFLFSAMQQYSCCQIQCIVTFNSSYGFIFNYDQTILINSLKIEVHLQNNATQCSLQAFNLGYMAISNYTFYFNKQLDFGFEYALIAFLIIVFILALFFLWYRTKDQDYQFGLQEFEELEIDTFQQ
ncbi:unnamed protein product (macronuclear) [Paramecium tetraurelia]|uniref:Transmembrane protein n=1 Tax=Paramecium tetraurelia TaxID=5888 RepID=A0CSS5_PARTE|nr:uncharacterized protein GSPATT00010114001 [Paramecium tetraurelia]CAK73842.1 unnamed protein product [Paramecium tetraurelia]|eukprot:XP_001441239.1 hypothetical protein (macronuclear) [Paramecium tetraurelia strain d4-2]